MVRLFRRRGDGAGQHRQEARDGALRVHRVGAQAVHGCAHVLPLFPGQPDRRLLRRRAHRDAVVALPRRLARHCLVLLQQGDAVLRDSQAGDRMLVQRPRRVRLRPRGRGVRRADGPEGAQTRRLGLPRVPRQGQRLPLPHRHRHPDRDHVPRQVFAHAHVHGRRRRDFGAALAPGCRRRGHEHDGNLRRVVRDVLPALLRPRGRRPETRGWPDPRQVQGRHHEDAHDVRYDLRHDRRRRLLLLDGPTRDLPEEEEAQG
mmetsp:Transcript_10750/g.46561  ORF Transcript_10750/g.46561 Transcript_10750/m.46561 type:complete len:259 (+) Transcript_10750:9436-10212(+)